MAKTREKSSGNSMAWNLIWPKGLLSLNLMGRWIMMSKRRTIYSMKMNNHEAQAIRWMLLGDILVDTITVHNEHLRIILVLRTEQYNTFSNNSGVEYVVRKDFDIRDTPRTFKAPANPYNAGQTPLTDKYLRQCNDFYLHGASGLSKAEDFTKDYYKDFGFPPSYYTSIRYSFIQLLEDQTIPYLDDKQIINLPCLVDLKPETFVDWYSAMESELIMISNVDLLPFDAITINYQYVGLCIPGVGEKHIWRWLGYSIAPTTRQCHMSLTL